MKLREKLGVNVFRWVQLGLADLYNSVLRFKGMKSTRILLLKGNNIIYFYHDFEKLKTYFIGSSELSSDIAKRIQDVKYVNATASLPFLLLF